MAHGWSIIDGRGSEDVWTNLPELFEKVMQRVCDTLSLEQKGM